MDDRQPSQTALAAAAARAAHLVVDNEPFLFRDPVAGVLIGEQGQEMVGFHRRSGDHIVLAGTRAQVTVRSRYTEDRLARLAEGGLDQYVILGAGLDTFACRSPLTGRVRVFEVDHPATQRWKLDLLAAQVIGGLAVTTVAVVPVVLFEGRTGVVIAELALLAFIGAVGYASARTIHVSRARALLSVLGVIALVLVVLWIKELVDH